MDAYVARQPIFNADKSLFGYELLFRDSMANFVPEIDGDTATSKLLSSSFFTMGFDKIIGDTKAFVNFTQNLLVQQIPLIFPSEFTVVEILEDVNPDADVVDACRQLKAKGYTIALDDFISRPEMQPLVDVADIVKIDFRAVAMDDMAAYIQPLKRSGVRLLAEKVETYDEFNRAVALGFVYFQGYFFCKPEIVRGKEISSSQLTLVEILAEANQPEIQFEKIRNIIERDVAISYKLLHYINSAFYKRAVEITTIKQALVILGEKEIKRFVSMIALAQLISDKPNELLNLSFVRAKFLESIGKSLGGAEEASRLFTLGLFSMIHAILDQPMNRIMEKLPLSAAIIDALVNGAGPLADYLKLAMDYEQGNWEKCAADAAQLNLDEASVPRFYAEACHWGSCLSQD